MKNEIITKALKLKLPFRVLLKVFVMVSSLEEDKLNNLNELLDGYEQKQKDIKKKYELEKLEINKNNLAKIKKLHQNMGKVYEKNVSQKESEAADLLLQSL